MTASTTSTATSTPRTPMAISSARPGARLSAARSSSHAASTRATTIVATDRGPFTRHSVLMVVGLIACGRAPGEAGRTMRFGLFGTGPWAHLAHAPALAQHPDVEL